MNILALDIGMKRTGVAYGETKSGIVMALDTIHHETANELSEKIATIVLSKKITSLIIGLPLLPSGEEGSQSNIVRSAAVLIKKSTGLEPEFLDERYTT